MEEISRSPRLSPERTASHSILTDPISFVFGCFPLDVCLRNLDMKQTLMYIGAHSRYALVLIGYGKHKKMFASSILTSVAFGHLPALQEGI